jgi:phospholipase C
VIFGENISFDHYFGTYPNALNPGNEPRFYAAPGTPTVNGYTDGLLFSNPNLLNKAGNAGGASTPFRLDRSQAATKRRSCIRGCAFGDAARADCER